MANEKRSNEEKERWVIGYIKKNWMGFVDMLDEDFVMAYIDEFNPKAVSRILGAPGCKELSRLLAKMYGDGQLKRFAHGVRSGLNQDNGNYKAPKWVYSYTLNE